MSEDSDKQLKDKQTVKQLKTVKQKITVLLFTAARLLTLVSWTFPVAGSAMRRRHPATAQGWQGRSGRPAGVCSSQAYTVAGWPIVNLALLCW